MARIAHPWYSHEKKMWMAYIHGKKTPLVKGEEDSATKAEARKKLREQLAFQKQAPAADRKPRTVASLIELYLSLNSDKYSPDALAQRRYYLQLFSEAFGWRSVNDEDCLPIHLEQWLGEHPDWKSAWTKHQVVTIVQRPFNWAVKKRLIPANPFRGVEQANGDPRRPLTEKEFQALLRSSTVWIKRKRNKKNYPSDQKRRQRPSAGARFREFLVFLRFTGARPGEASLLEWQHIDLETGLIKLAKHKASKAQKVKKPRVIPLHPVVLKLLIHIKRRQESSTQVFLNHRKAPWNRRALSCRLRRARQAAGLPSDAKLYGLRHGFGTRSILNGVDIKTLSELMGHSTTRMTEHYLHLAGHQGHLAAAMLQANARRQGV